MRIALRYPTTLLAAAAVMAAPLVPAASAQTDSTLPQCVGTGPSDDEGGSATECSSPGNVQIVDTPAQTQFLYPWADDYYGPALMIGGR
jgi:hypothetical protein